MRLGVHFVFVKIELLVANDDVEVIVVNIQWTGSRTEVILSEHQMGCPLPEVHIGEDRGQGEYDDEQCCIAEHDEEYRVWFISRENLGISRDLDQRS